MAARGNLFRSLQDLDAAGSNERKMARLKRQQRHSAEILQTFLAYRLVDAAEKMELGIAIGDPLLLRHEPDNQWDPNAVKVFWQEQWIGYIPKDMAALIAAEVPEVAEGLEAVVTGLTTTSLRDAFRLQISIPIPKASRRLRELGVTSAFAWDFDRTSGADKLRLVISCTETAFRELQELLNGGYDVSKCGYSYYPTQDGRHYPWYLSLTGQEGKAPEDEAAVETLIRSLFGVASESSRRHEREKRFKDLEEKQETIGRRLEVSQAEERRLRREFEFNKSAWERRTSKAEELGDEAIELAQTMEVELKGELDLKEQELQLALAENQSLEDQLAQISNEIDALSAQLEYYQQEVGGRSTGLDGDAGLHSANGLGQDHTQSRLLRGLRDLAERSKPERILELVNNVLCTESFVVLDSAWNSAREAKGFEHGDQLFELLWTLGTDYRHQKITGAPDLIAGQEFGNRYAPRESSTTEDNPKARKARTFTYNGEEIEMWQHLKIGAKDSINRTLRIHFYWDSNSGRVVIGHCGKHLFNPKH